MASPQAPPLLAGPSPPAHAPFKAACQCTCFLEHCPSSPLSKQEDGSLLGVPVVKTKTSRSAGHAAEGVVAGGGDRRAAF